MDNLWINRTVHVDVYLTKHNIEIPLSVNFVHTSTCTINKNKNIQIPINRQIKILIELKKHFIEIPITINSKVQQQIIEHTTSKEVSIPLSINKNYKMSLFIQENPIEISLKINKTKNMTLSISELIQLWKMKLLYDSNNISHITLKNMSEYTTSYTTQGITKSLLKNIMISTHSLNINTKHYINLKNTSSQTMVMGFNSSTALIDVQHIQDMDNININVFDVKPIITLEHKTT